MSTVFDEFMFMAIKGSKSIEDILENFFSFLRRHTDFYHTMVGEEELKMLNLDPSVNSKGFLPNQMIDLVNRIVDHNFSLYRLSHQPYLLPAKNGAFLNPQKMGMEASFANAQRLPSEYPYTNPPIVNVEPSSRLVQPIAPVPPVQMPNVPTIQVPQVQLQQVQVHPVQPVQLVKQDTREAYDPVAYGPKSYETLPYGPASFEAPRYEPAYESPVPFPNLNYTISTWNGAVTQKYAWSQNIREVTVEVLARARLAPRDVSVTVTKDRLRVVLHGNVVIDGEFCRRVNSSDTIWSIEDGCRILLNIEKTEEYWWDCVIKGDETIDTQQIESTKRLDEFSTPEQCTILKMMNDHRQK